MRAENQEPSNKKNWSPKKNISANACVVLEKIWTVGHI